MALFQRRGGGQDTGLCLLPMIDCVFLLLMFFVVSAIMRTSPPFSAAFPESETGYEISKWPRREEKPSQGKQETTSWRYGVVIDVMERAKQRFSTPEGIEYHIPNNQHEKLIEGGKLWLYFSGGVVGKRQS